MTLEGADLRALVREVVRDAVADLVPQPSAVSHNGFQPTGPLAAGEKTRTDTVRIATDTDLDAFVRHLLRLFENPKTRADVRNGRLSFRLAGNASGAQASAHRVDRGAVTERQIVDVAASGGALILGPRAVLTPLAREKARALGVSIQKERK
ncbi:hypothetical protein ACGFK1_14730 [Mycobacterium sp. NPDC048908]|uniref:hypothetical protein n=1 Tax=Mycobacterium sp. NPDC048908 TaxID=3364292 RepID=UPI00371789AA